jgi:hypothetical protein
MGKYQIPITYAWAEEIASGEMGPEVPNGNGLAEPRAETEAEAEAA